ncbi:MAG: methyltransferase domain-containing protein [Anaerolineae bacterium]|nr:methyltransferase domain-containing protein [Anaerolineae bacterium]
MKTQAITPCLVCNSTNTEVILSIPHFPVHCNVLWDTKEEATQAPRGDIELLYCHTCGHIFNHLFDPILMEYSQDYENSLHFSLRFQAYAESLAHHLAENYKLEGKTVIEVGCGKGDFLQLLCQVGRCRGIGFDRSYVPNLADETRENVTFVQDFFSEQYDYYEADLICCRHVLEHIPTPRDFINTIQRSARHQSKTAFFFEVPNALSTIRDMAIWDIIYEHCSYFTPNSLVYLFEKCGFHITSIEEVYGGQFLCLEASHSEKQTLSTNGQSKSRADLSSYVQEFTQRYYTTLKDWETKLQEIRHSGRTAVIWGAGSKGVTLLNILETQDFIHYAVDINPRKHNKYIPGSGQQIVPPHFLKSYQPDVVIGMNPLYHDEIKQTLASYDVKSDLIFAVNTDS